jgi:hypothetical protein
MKAIYCSLIVAVFLISHAAAQSGDAKTERPRVVGSEESSKTTAAPAPKPQPTVEKPAESDTLREVKTGRTMSFREIKSKIAEAKRELQTKPLATAAVTTPDGKTAEFVRIAFHDPKKNKIDFLVLTKEQFLSVDEEEVLSSEKGDTVRVRTIRGNGVNTPVVLLTTPARIICRDGAIPGDPERQVHRVAYYMSDASGPCHARGCKRGPALCKKCY